MNPLRLTLTATTLIVIALAALTGHVGYEAKQSGAALQQQEIFLEAGRQAAINLTTIDHARAEQDVEQILDSAAGTFHDDFQRRAQPFIDLVKKTQSVSQGTVTAAALESVDRDRAQVVVAMSVTTTIKGATEEHPRGWRMRLTLQKVDDIPKVSDVQFVA